MFGSNNGTDVDLTGCDIWATEGVVWGYRHPFQKWAMTMLAEAFRMDHQYAVTHSAWTIGTVERQNKVIRTAKAIFS